MFTLRTTRRGGKLLRAGLSLALVAALSSSCAHRDAAVQDPTSAAAVEPPASLAEAEIRYGKAPTRNSEVVYQPDVVIPAGGAQAVRSVSSNGLTWSIDANAPGASDLAPGKIMFLTGRAVGRVLKLDRSGDDLAVMLGPVELTDVIRQTHLSGTQTIDPSTMRTYSAPDWPGADAETLSAAPAETPQRRLADEYPTFASLESPRLGTSDVDAPRLASNATVPELAQVPGAVGPVKELVRKFMTVNPFLGGGLGANFSIPSMNYGNAPARAEGSIMFTMSNPFVSWDINITPAGLETAKLEVHNAAGLTIRFQANSSDQFTPNQNAKGLAFLPMDLSFPLGGPVPISLVMHQTFWLQTIFSAKTSILKGTAEYGFEGSLKLECHFSTCHASAPGGFKVRQSLMDSLAANPPSLGVNGIVLTYEGRVIVGLGAFGFVTGPYIGMAVSVGVTRGSDTSDFITMPCRQTDLAVWSKAGVGYAMPQVVAKIINFFLSAASVKPINAVGGPGVTASMALPGTPPGHQTIGCGGDAKST